MWIKDGQLYSAGSPQYGQLGHGSTHEYNTKDSSVKMAFEPQPTPNPIQAFAGKKVTKARAEAIRRCALPFPRARRPARTQHPLSHEHVRAYVHGAFAFCALRRFAHAVGGVRYAAVKITRLPPTAKAWCTPGAVVRSPSLVALSLAIGTAHIRVPFAASMATSTGQGRTRVA